MKKMSKVVLIIGIISIFLLGLFIGCDDNLVSDDLGPEPRAATVSLVGDVEITTDQYFIIQSYELLDESNKRIELDASRVTKVTVLNPGASKATELSVQENSDELLWFDVRKPSGNYKYTVETKDGDIYVATLKWTAPQSIDIEKQGKDLVMCGDGIERYHYKINIAIEIEDTLVYRVKPTGLIDQQTINNDSDDFSIYFRPTDANFTQLVGPHTYVIKKGETWYEGAIIYED
jgi:hypothetical protein